MLTMHNPQKIATLNDAARKSFTGCRVYMTPGVQALNQTQAIVARVQAYNDFTEQNDPYGKHDFGSFEFCGETIFWKIEYYDLNFQMHSLDPSDPTITARVLTIMLGHEY
ncbi:MAG: DUF3768 domain-containing protein [Paracoccaceae bacterium]|jgi:hypothetical protein|nr:DUF3768 domain-containing protein [Paracoccaceae bacterium]